MIIGLAGPAGSGKSTISKYLSSKHNFYPITFSDVLIEEALKRKIIEKNFRKDDEKVKNILSKFGKELRKETGKEDILAIKIVEKIKRLGLKRVCVDGFRSKEEVEYFRKNFKDFYLISVKAEKEKRIERRKKLDLNFDIKDFEEREKRFEKDLREVLEMKDFEIENNSRLDNLYKKIDKLIEKINYGCNRSNKEKKVDKKL